MPVTRSTPTAATAVQGQTSYVGAKTFGGTWYAINASGGTVK